MRDFSDHTIKHVIRNQWCKPLIKHICEKLGYKLTYLGLPGIEAIDILTWIEYINKVIAFEIGDGSKEYNEEKANKNIKKLNSILDELETKGKLDSYSLFHGYLEDIVIKGIDKKGFKFNQDSNVRVYNLDFCNSLTSPRRIIDINGDTIEYYKSEAIRKILEIQRDIAKEKKESKFILFLTVHSHFLEEEARARKVFSGSIYKVIYNKHKNSINQLGESEKNIRLLRLYLITTLSQQFCSCQFIPEFFPSLYYEGSGGNKLICFTVLGTFDDNPSAVAPFFQNIEELISEKFLNPQKTKIEHLIQKNVTELNCIKDPIKNIESFKSYNESWVK